MSSFSRRKRVAVLAAYLLSGALMMQVGGCLGMALNMGATAFDASSLLDDNGLLFGTFAPCGRANVIIVDENGVPDGDILYAGDDMIWDCPVTEVVRATPP